mmetsp:Transcript_24070/g.78358  ORF Transcript_24070/g.78358 Transcript_24070/m.78358 type:complete len:622 (-) Transcript_24070:924-2789(-)
MWAFRSRKPAVPEEDQVIQATPARSPLTGGSHPLAETLQFERARVDSAGSLVGGPVSPLRRESGNEAGTSGGEASGGAVERVGGERVGVSSSGSATSGATPSASSPGGAGAGAGAGAVAEAGAVEARASSGGEAAAVQDAGGRSEAGAGAGAGARGVALLDASVMPDSNAKVDLLLRFFRSDFFNAWIAVSYLWRSQQEGVTSYLCNQLYDLPDQDIESYLNQLVILVVERKGNELERTAVDLCRRSFRLAIKVCWLLSAAKEGKQLEYVAKLETACIEASRHAVWAAPFANEPSTPLLAGTGLGGAAGAGAGDNNNSNNTGAPEAPRHGPHSSASSFPDPEDPHHERKLSSPFDLDGILDLARDGGAAAPGVGAAAPAPALSSDKEKDAFGSPTAPVAAAAAAVVVETDDERMRRATFEGTMGFVSELAGLSGSLAKVSQQEKRRPLLLQALEKLSRSIEERSPREGVHFPLGKRRARVLRIPSGEAVLLNSREKAPLFLCVEVLQLRDDGRAGDVTPPATAAAAAAAPATEAPPGVCSKAGGARRWCSAAPATTTTVGVPAPAPATPALASPSEHCAGSPSPRASNAELSGVSGPDADETPRAASRTDPSAPPPPALDF